MNALVNAVPDVDVMLALEPEELGAKILFLLRQQHGMGMVLPNYITESMIEGHQPGPAYPRRRAAEAHQAVREAWVWLEAQGLLIPADGTNGQNGWRTLSRRAMKFENEAEFANYAVARRLPREALHPTIAGPVWMSFMRGEFDTAVFQATKAVEVAVRDAGGFDHTSYGVDMMRKAFHPENGPLTDMGATKAEREATMALFAGAIDSFKNPQAHRNVSLENPAEAAEIVMFASYLLRVVDGARPQ